jgi:hypothetical protein
MDRALLVLGAALPDVSYDSLADWTPGRCNKALAELHCLCFGSVLNGWLACERCTDRLEFEMDAHAIAGPPAGGDGPIDVNGWTFRLPTIRDLAGVAAAGEASGGVQRLLRSCMVAPDDAGTWSEADIEAIGARMEAADPLAETRLMFRCANCGHEWAANLDIASFVWEQIAARAGRAIAEVHALASAYGWTEAEILSLSEARRSRYLEMVRA